MYIHFRHYELVKSFIPRVTKIFRHPHASRLHGLRLCFGWTRSSLNYLSINDLGLNHLLFNSLRLDILSMNYLILNYLRLEFLKLKLKFLAGIELGFMHVAGRKAGEQGGRKAKGKAKG